MKPTQVEREVIREQYRMAFPFCQIAQEIGVLWVEQRGKVVMQKECVGLQISGTGPHHVFHVGTRLDVFSNLCTTAMFPHKLIHDGANGEARWIPMLCVLAKLRCLARLGEPQWFNLADANLATGRGGGLIGWAETLPDFGRDDLRKWRDETVDRVRLLAREAA